MSGPLGKRRAPRGTGRRRPQKLNAYVTDRVLAEVDELAEENGWTRSLTASALIEAGLKFHPQAVEQVRLMDEHMLSGEQ